MLKLLKFGLVAWLVGASVVHAQQAVNINQVGGTATSTGNGTTDAGTIRVTVASNSTGIIAVTQSGTWDEIGINDSGNSITVDNATLSVVGGGVEATALRVTIASDSTGVLSIDDNGGSLTVDGTITVTDGAGPLNVIVDSGTVTTVSTVTSLSQLGGVALPIEDAAETAAGVGIYAMSVRRDTAASSAGTTGDNATVNTDATGLLWVRIGASDVATGGTSLADDGDFTAGTTTFTPAGGFYQSVVTACTDGDACAVGITAQRTAKVTLYSAAGAELTPSADATHDAAATTTGPQIMAEFDDTTPDSVDEGDAGRLRISANRNLYGTIRDAAGNERGANVTAANELLVELGAGAASIGILGANSGVDIGDVTINNASLAVTNGGTFAVQVDGALLTSSQLIDDTIVMLGTATYTEATSVGQAIGAVRRDADTTLVGTTNEWGPLQMDANGRLKVEVFSGETLPVSLTSTTITGTVAVTQSGTWDEIGINDSGNSITVDNGGTFAVQVDGAALTALQLIDDVVRVEDAAETVGTGLAMAGSVRRDTAASSAGTTGDNATVNTDATGLLWVRIGASDVATGGTSLTDGATFTAGTTTLTPAGGFYQSAVSACVDGDACAIGITAQRTAKVTLFSAAGAELTPSADATHDSAVAATGPQQMSEAKDFDGAALPNVVSAEGDASRVASSLYGVQYVMAVNEDGSAVGTVTVGAITAGDTDIGNVDLEIAGTGVSAGVGASGAQTLRVAALIHDGTDTALVQADGDLQVECSNCSGSGASAIDDSAFTATSDDVAPAGFLYDTTPPSITDGRVGLARMNSARQALVEVAASALPAGAALESEQVAQTVQLEAIEDHTGFLIEAVKTVGLDTYTEALTASVVSGAVRRDADTTLVDTTNEIAPLQVDARGFLKVEVFSGETLPVSLTSTTITGTVAVTQSGTWDEIGINDSGNSITVDNGGTFATQVDGAALTALQLIDNPVQVLGTATYTEATSSGFAIGAVRRDADTTLVDTTNEFGPLQMDANGRLKVEVFSGETLPVSGTVTVTDFGTVFGADAIFGTAGTADTDVLSVQGIASMTPLLVNPGTATNFAVYVEDVAETAGSNVVVAASVRRDTAASSAGTTGDYATTNTDSIGRLWVTATEIEDVAETAGGQLAMAGSVRRDVAASSAGASGDNATLNTDNIGNLWTRLIDPCSGIAKTFIPIDIVTAATTEITPSLAGASTHYYICSLVLVTDAANDVAVVDDNTDNCVSPTAGIFGGFATAAEGWNFGANGGLTLGNGANSVGRTTTSNAVICIITSAATQLSGMMTVVAAP